MAAIDLERGLEHSGRGWGQERPEMMDNFDSEIEEWEDQLQDIQRKIEELYNEVQARRGANDVANDNQKNAGDLECSLGRHGNGLFAPGHHGKNHPGAVSAPHCYSNGCNYNPSGCGYPVTHQNGYGYCHADGVSEIGDLLQDYLGQGKQMSRRNNGARHVHFSDTIKVSQDVPEARGRSGNDRLDQGQFLGSFEETENWKNRVSHMKTSPRRESSPNKENSGTKPPLGQRDGAAVQPRSQLTPTNSPALDRKSFGAGVLGDRKCSSPSVLRKFGAMLQENEGKTLTESGVVAPQGPALEPKCPTPGCQRRAAASSRTKKSQAEPDGMTEMEDWGLAADSPRQSHREHRGSFSGCKGSQPSPQQAHRRTQVVGSPKVRPRANSGQADRRTAPHHMEPKLDYRLSNSSSGAQRVHRGGFVGQEAPGCGRVRDEGLIELLDMLDIQHEYSSSPRTAHSAYRQEPQQVHPAEPSPVTPNRSFSRPARPANQRPPSRWAARTPTARITAPSGPLYRPPSPLSRPPSPRTRTPSPAMKHRPIVSYSLQPETVIM